MSYASCDCSYDLPEFASDHAVKAARKQYRCDECLVQIQPGQPYSYTAGKWEGNVTTFRRCPRCEELLRWARISAPCFCWEYGNLHEHVRGMVSEVHKDVPGLIFEWGRRMVKIRRQMTHHSRRESRNE